MLYQPNATDFALLQRAVWEPSAVTLARCPGKDQRLHNSVFRGRWTNLATVVDRQKEGAPRATRDTISLHFHYNAPAAWFPAWWAEHMATMPDPVRTTCGPLFQPAKKEEEPAEQPPPVEYVYRRKNATAKTSEPAAPPPGRSAPGAGVFLNRHSAVTALAAAGLIYGLYLMMVDMHTEAD